MRIRTFLDYPYRVGFQNIKQAFAKDRSLIQTKVAAAVKGKFPKLKRTLKSLGHRSVTLLKGLALSIPLLNIPIFLLLQKYTSWKNGKDVQAVLKPQQQSQKEDEKIEKNFEKNIKPVILKNWESLRQSTDLSFEFTKSKNGERLLVINHGDDIRQSLKIDNKSNKQVINDAKTPLIRIRAELHFKTFKPDTPNLTSYLENDEKGEWFEDLYSSAKLATVVDKIQNEFKYLANELLSKQATLQVDENDLNKALSAVRSPIKLHINIEHRDQVTIEIPFKMNGSSSTEKITLTRKMILESALAGLIEG